MSRPDGKEGFFLDADTAPQGMHPMLVLLRSELIREISMPASTDVPRHR